MQTDAVISVTSLPLELICSSSMLCSKSAECDRQMCLFQCASVVALVVPGFKSGTHASLLQPDLVLLSWLLLTRSNRTAGDQGPFLDAFCDHFPCVCLTQTRIARKMFRYIIYSELHLASIF